MLIIYIVAVKCKTIVTYGDIKFQDVFIRYIMLVYLLWNYQFDHLVIYVCTFLLSSITIFNNQKPFSITIFNNKKPFSSVSRKTTTNFDGFKVEVYHLAATGFYKSPLAQI